MRSQARRLAWAVSLALVVAACDTSTISTTTTSIPATTTSAPAAPTTTEDPLLGLALPLDPDVARATLDNGLTYYVRQNDSPGRRVELRLLVDAGSVQEDPDQAGMAHFLEHMMFNGTERFPRNELISVLEAFGPRFGPDINAHTNFDETVYELSLSTDDPELVELGVDVLREWASRATLTEEDVEAERGVILDEWRLRAQGFGARVNDQLNGLLLPGSVYEGHPPIGTAESISTTSRAELQRFYDDWYRPDRMAVVAVGDIDVASMENLIVEAFSDLEPVEEPRRWEPTVFEPPGEPRVASYVDEEATSGGISVIWPVSSDPAATVGDVQDSISTSLALQILNERLSDEALAGNGPLLGASVIDLDWTRTIGVRGVDVLVRPEQAAAGMERVLHEVERMRRFGVSDEEFNRVVTQFSTVSRQVFDQQESAQDTHFATQISAHHLGGDPLMSPSQRFDIESDTIDRLTRQDVESAVASLVGEAPVVLALGPDDSGLDIPSESQILEVLEGLSTVTLEPRDEGGVGEVELMVAPQPAEVVESAVHPELAFKTLEFGNGASVFLWESQIASQSVYARIEGFGGTSLVEIEDLPEAQLVTDIVGRSGVADIDIPTLRRLLADRIVAVQPWIQETRQGLDASSSSNDIETLLQLIHLTMTDPRFDNAAVDAVLDEMRTLNASRSDLPDLLFEEALVEGYYGDDPRYFVVPSADQIADFDLSAAESVFRERFSDAGDFAFAFVGDFDIDTMTDLAARYIGGLPGDGDPAGFVDNQPLPPREVQVFEVAAGAGEQGQLGMFFTNEFEPVLEDRVAARLLELILTSRLRERVREQLSATYSISVGIDLQRDPDPFAEAFVNSTGDPARLEEISEEVMTDIASLQQDGPSEAQFDTAVEQLRDEMELVTNQVIATALITSDLYPDQPVSELSERHAVVDELTPADIQSLANAVFNLGQRIEVRQIPRP